MNINRDHQSPNYYPAHYRRSTDILVIHATAADTWSSTMHWFKNPASQASAHYVIDKNGDIYQMVPEVFPAWHAGYSNWNGKDDINRDSIGIELVNNAYSAYPQEQIDACIELSRDIMKRHATISHNLVRHSDISPGRKTDPYSHFPWDEFKRNVCGDKKPDEVSAEPAPWAEKDWGKWMEEGVLSEQSIPSQQTTKQELAVFFTRFENYLSKKI